MTDLTAVCVLISGGVFMKSQNIKSVNKCFPPTGLISHLIIFYFFYIKASNFVLFATFMLAVDYLPNKPAVLAQCCRFPKSYTAFEALMLVLIAY